MPKLLLIEDNEQIRRIYSEKFRREGFDVTTAADGEQGVATAVSTHPDVVLLDIMLPKLNGFEVLQEFQRSTDLRTVPVFMLSNRAWPADVEHALSLGARQFYSKGSASLQDIVQQIRADCGLKKVSIVSHNIMGANSLAAPLSHPQLLCALSTVAAEACSATERGAPDLIVLDGRHPTASAVLQQIKASAALRTTPLIAVTDNPVAMHRADECLAASAISTALRAAVLCRLALADDLALVPSHN